MTEPKTLLDLTGEEQAKYQTPIVMGKLDHVWHDLQTPIRGRQAELIELDTEPGWRTYRRSVLFLLVTAVQELYPEAQVIAQFTANKGLFCEIHSSAWTLNLERTQAIAAQMRKIVAEDRPIVKKTCPREEAVALFTAHKQPAKAKLVAELAQDMVSIYQCGGTEDYFYGAMVPHTGLLDRFALDYEAPGVLLRTPDVLTHGEVRAYVPQPKLSHVLSESEEWARILDCQYVSDLNRLNRTGQMGEVIRVSEALQEKHIAQIAEHIAGHHDALRLVLIAGPSSSGKTSFAQRLRIQLRTNGLHPISISLDDYFKNRIDTPRLPNGEYDYECLEALDVAQFNQDMLALMAGKSVMLPLYNFLTGEREWHEERTISVAAGEPIIIEGIHGLNEKLTEAVPRANKYKIYVSALNQLNIDAHNRIPTTLARLMRRLVRDYQFRGAHAVKTLHQLPVVRAGEEKYIFPYQEEADVMFNSALIYELGILKRYARPLLEHVTPDVPEYTMAQYLLSFFQYADDVTDEDDVPNNSILREFIGKSVFFK